MVYFRKMVWDTQGTKHVQNGILLSHKFRANIEMATDKHLCYKMISILLLSHPEMQFPENGPFPKDTS